jgi:predicted ATPase/serine/threonine protein kinase
VNEIVGGRYKLIKRLGTGGMAEVFLAEQAGPRGFARQAVIKRIHAHLAKDPVFTASFEQEARLAAQLQHPHIVRTEDFGDDDGNLYIVLEYVRGDELARLSKHLNSVGQRLPVNVVLQIGVDIADALDFAHKMPDGQGVPLEIVHRDVSPQNIMLNAAGQAKLLDFGIARAASNESITEAGKVKGKIAYFCPEQARGEHLDGRGDQFALAIVLYELMARKRLFADRDVMATLNRVNRCKVPSLLTIDASIPRALNDALLRALSRDKAQRFADCAAFSEALSECLEVHGGRWSARKFGRWRSAFPDSLASKPGKYFAPLVLVADAQTDAAENKTLIERVQEEPVWAPWSEGDSDQTVATIAVSEALDLTVADGEPPTFLENSNIIEASNSFFGRGEELDELKACIDQGRRLITLVGAGGSGKTRLSQHFGLQHTARFAGGVWFCDLSEARGAPGLVSAMGSSLGLLLDQSDPEMQIAAALLGRGHALIILDNVEQILDDAAAALKTWLRKSPESVFLLTSRSPVRLQDEVVIRLDPLPIAEAMQLFYHRGRAVRAGFAPSDSNQPIVKEIVERLDCLALAIELAAVRVRSLSPEQIRQRLKQRFRLLRGQRRDQAARQATLQGAIDWSWNLLKANERSALAQLAIFRGGCTIEATERILDLETLGDASWVLDSVEALVDHSLLCRIEPVEGHSRYRLMESVREYALQKLGDDGPAVALRHAQYFAAFGSEEFLDSLDTHGGARRRLTLALELENLVAGVESALVAKRFELAACCGLGAGAIFLMKGPYRDGVALLNRVLQKPLEPLLHMRLLLQATVVEHFAGEIAEGLIHVQDALDITRKEGARDYEGQTLSALADLNLEQGRTVEALAHYEQALVIAREVGNRRSEGGVLANLGSRHLLQGRMAEALMGFEQALAIARETGNRRMEGNILDNLGNLHKEQGKVARALTHYHQALAIHREVGNRRSEGIVLGNLATLHKDQGRTAEALASYEQALGIAREVSNRRLEGVVLGNLGDLLYVTSEPSAERHLRQAIEISDDILPGAAGAFRGTLALIRAENGALDEARILLGIADSQLRGVYAVELAKLLCRRARVEQLAGAAATAATALAEAETIAVEVKAGPKSDLGQELSKARSVLNTLSSANSAR